MIADIQAGRARWESWSRTTKCTISVDSVAGRVDNVLEAVQNQQGTLGKLIYEPTIHESAKKLIDNGNAFLADIRAGKGTLGKLATDDSFSRSTSRPARICPARPQR